MIIHQPETAFQDGEITVSANIEVSNKNFNLPSRLWFTVPETYKSYLDLRSDSFATSLLLLAMYLDEPLDVRGVISSRLAYGLQEYQYIFHQWLPKRLKLITLKFSDPVETKSKLEHGKVGAAFSGGIDSLYTLFTHLPENQRLPSFQISHGLFVHGFDIYLHEKERFQFLSKKYEPFFNSLGIQLLSARTNSAAFTQFTLNFRYTHGGLLIGVALLFQNLFNRFYIPSSENYLYLHPAGTTAVSDHWLSTETLDILHDGAALRRFQKLAILSEWPASYNQLRVCPEINLSPEVINCGKCDKCVRTLLMLEILKKPAIFDTFPQNFRNRNFHYLLTTINPPFFVSNQIMKESIASHRWDIFLLFLPILLFEKIKDFVIPKLLNLFPNEPFFTLKKRIYKKYARLESN